MYRRYFSLYSSLTGLYFKTNVTKNNSLHKNYFLNSIVVCLHKHSVIKIPDKFYLQYISTYRVLAVFKIQWKNIGRARKLSLF